MNDVKQGKLSSSSSSSNIDDDDDDSSSDCRSNTGKYRTYNVYIPSFSGLMTVTRSFACASL